MESYIQIAINFTNERQCEILIAVLSEYGFEGFEENQNQLLAFTPEKKFQEKDMETILSNMSLSYSKKNIPQKNWNEEWEKNFESITINDFCGVRASFHQPIKNVLYEIIITPKMSFGTGHHATTYLMIDAMKNINFKNKTVLDFGTGTGILAILAEKLGAKKIIAIDNDEWSIDNAIENLIANNCKAISIEKKDTIPFTENGFDIILANINRNVILEQLPFFKQQLTSKGVLLVSGLLNEDYKEMELQTTINNLSITRKYLKSNWICLELYLSLDGVGKENS